MSHICTHVGVLIRRGMQVIYIYTPAMQDREGDGEEGEERERG